MASLPWWTWGILEKLQKFNSLPQFTTFSLSSLSRTLASGPWNLQDAPSLIVRTNKNHSFQFFTMFFPKQTNPANQISPAWWFQPFPAIFGILTSTNHQSGDITMWGPYNLSRLYHFFARFLSPTTNMGLHANTKYPQTQGFIIISSIELPFRGISHFQRHSHSFISHCILVNLRFEPHIGGSIPRTIPQDWMVYPYHPLSNKETWRLVYSYWFPLYGPLFCTFPDPKTPVFQSGCLVFRLLKERRCFIRSCFCAKALLGIEKCIIKSADWCRKLCGTTFMVLE